jgi:hypothetical protein
MNTLNLFAFFHLNMMFSSIAEERRPEIIAKAYWPLLSLPDKTGAPIGVEATGLTLEIIQSIDPKFIAALREKIASGQIELIGSGYAQIIGPITPALVNRRNLALGVSVYEELLHVRPQLALINEQAYSGGLLPLYREAGFACILMDWDNLAPHHPDWPPEARYRVQHALAPDNSTLPVLWTQTLTFQRLQRYAHGELTLEEYLKTISAFKSATPRTLCLYSNDAEIFNVRPHRLATEEAASDVDEWARIASAWSRIVSSPGMKFLSPSAAFAESLQTDEPALIRLETPAYPIPVKKQPKYNVTRWAVSGRDNLGLNAACERLTNALARNPHATDADWKSLCRLWSSDFRTHIGDARWHGVLNEIQRCEQDLGASLTQVFLPPLAGEVPRACAGKGDLSRWLDIETPSLFLRLNRRRGLAIDSIARTGDNRPAMLGSLLHGHFHDIALQYDWYTGNAVFEAPGQSKVTDLDWVLPLIERDNATHTVTLEAEIATRLGPIHKRLTIHGREPRIDFDFVFHWPEWGNGSLRAGHFLLRPDAFDWPSLSVSTRSGGEHIETFSLDGNAIDHGAAVSFLVSATTGLGMTDGALTISDTRRSFRIEVDREVAPLFGLIQNQMTVDGPFTRIMLSAIETDDTRKPAPGPHAPRHMRYALILE